MTKSISSVAGLDPRVVVFAIGAAAIVVLAGMVLGYDIDLNTQGGHLRLSKLDDAPLRLREE